MGRSNCECKKGFCCHPCEVWLQCSLKAKMFQLAWELQIFPLFGAMNIIIIKHNRPIDITRRSAIHSQQDGRAKVDFVPGVGWNNSPLFKLNI